MMFTLGISYEDRLETAVYKTKEALKNKHLKLDFVTKIEAVLCEVVQEDIELSIENKKTTMILSFKKQFVNPIVKLEKKHTIRKDYYNRWHEGKLIHAATGVRTPEYNEFSRMHCTGTQKISIKYLDGQPRVYVDGLKLTDFGVKQLAINDGFDSVSDFFKWFNTDFEGKIIHWEDNRY